MPEYIYRGPNITYVDGPHKGKSFINGKRYTDFPEEITKKMHLIVEYLPAPEKGEELISIGKTIFYDEKKMNTNDDPRFTNDE